MNYEFKTTPYSHQLEHFDAYRNKQAWGVLWDQGTGKTKVLLDTIAHLYDHGKIDGVLVIAPNGVHRNWINDEIPVHFPDRIDVRTGFYESKRANTQKHEYLMRGLVHNKGLSIVAMSYNAAITKKGRTFVAAFLKRRVMFVLDEAHMIKTPSAKRSKAIIAMGKHATARRIATGTLIANGCPFDAYMPIRFLDPDFWKSHGLSTYAEFKVHFGIWKKGYNSAQARDFEFCVAYRRLDKLREWLSEISDRVEKDDVLDLPPKLYSKRYFDLSPEQVRVYRDIKTEALAMLASGEIVTAPLAITRLLRLQQVTCGYVPTDDSEAEWEKSRGWTKDVELLGDKNPRLDLLLELCDSIAHGVIIWARFRKDIDLIMAALGERAVRYDGKVSDDDREKAKHAFQNGDVQFFVGNPAAGSTGITLTAARTVIYYNNSFKLVERIQSEDRAHRAGQEHPVDYIDIVAANTVDVAITDALRDKQTIAREITGDKLKEWI